MAGEESYGTVIDEDTLSYSNGICEISLSQFHKCILEGSKEMSKGGMETRIIKGVPIQIPVPNQREVFINSVKGMEDILIPEILNLDQFSKELDEIDVKIQKMRREILNLHDEYVQEHRGEKIDWENIKDKHYDKIEAELVRFYREKLRLFSRVLNTINYHQEGSI